jgi:hypothetical protein
MENRDGRPLDEDILEILKSLKNCEYETEEEEDEKILYLLKFYPGISDLIFHDTRNLTPEQILEEAKNKIKPILL